MIYDSPDLLPVPLECNFELPEVRSISLPGFGVGFDVDIGLQRAPSLSSRFLTHALS